jgi:chorismate dehydratase
MTDPRENGEHATYRLGVVSFLNARPLMDGLDADPLVSLQPAVPSALADLLRAGDVEAALIPVIDLAREGRDWTRISDAGIGCDGDTMTVRVFSRVPPEAVTVLHADTDSHTSVALARLIWKHRYHRDITILPLTAAPSREACESVLLIGDKVVTRPPAGFDREIDLGEVWREWQELPFVFAVWAARAEADTRELAEILNRARDRGVARAAAIAERLGPEHGWPVDLAREYLGRRLKYTVTPDAQHGMRRFLDLAIAEGIVPEEGALVR